MEEKIFKLLYEAADEDKALKMASYMKNRFPFLGINKPERANIVQDFIREKKGEREIDWQFVYNCYEKKEREFHYLAIDYLLSVKKYLKKDDIYKIKQLVVRNSWWDSTDALVNLFAALILRYPELKSVMLGFSGSDNIWLKRSAIIFQLKYKEHTDRDFLSRVIIDNAKTKEFFIDKAIGWVLREFSKTDQKWVRDFLAHHDLANLSVKEASKYL